MPILDGAKSASLLPSGTVALLNAYGDALAAAAVARQRAEGIAIADMLGLIVDDGEDETVGVAVTTEVIETLLEDAPPDDRPRLRDFIARPVPATHLRIIVWDANGIGMLRVDVVPPNGGGQA